MSKTQINPAKLEEQGVKIQYEDLWDGQGTERHSEPDPTRVRGIFLNLSPEDWCRIAMSGGDEYIGGCCGTTSAMQDVVNGVFRDGGYADADAMYSLGQYAKAHPDGFKETWNDRISQEMFDEAAGRFKNLRAWDKIALAWQAVRDKVKPWQSTIGPIVQENRPDLDERREIDELCTAAHYLHYSSSGLFRPQEDKGGQHHANDVMAFAKLYPGAKRLVAKLETEFTTWSGFAVVEKNRPEVIVHNGLGACVYNTREDVQEFFELLDRDDRYEKSERKKPREIPSEKLRVRPVTISIAKGVTFND